MKIGAITVGQAPRVDVTADIMDILGHRTELLERGGLDGLSREEIERFTYGILDEAGQVGVMIGADCTVPTDIDDERLDWVREACKKYAASH